VVEVRLLGALEVWSGSTRVPVGGARAECVLAVLLLENDHVVLVDRLVEAVWGERPPMTATTQVRKVVPSCVAGCPVERT
jgi:DNA-binding SARP family transcriptional activator